MWFLKYLVWQVSDFFSCIMTKACNVFQSYISYDLEMPLKHFKKIIDSWYAVNFSLNNKGNVFSLLKRKRTSMTVKLKIS